MSLYPSENKEILIIDDEQEILDLLSAYLTAIGWNVTISTSPKKALEILSNTEFFLIITDIAMPDMDGYELITKIRKMNCHSKIALMTGFGYNPKHTLVKINRKEKLHVFFKPFEFKNNQFSETIQSFYKDFISEQQDNKNNL